MMEMEARQILFRRDSFGFVKAGKTGCLDRA
jgi:hypothetical protein